MSLKGKLAMKRQDVFEVRARGQAGGMVIMDAWLRERGVRGSGGGVITPTPLRSTDEPATFIAHNGDTAQGSGATKEYVFTDGVNVLDGWHYAPENIDECPVFQAGEAATLGTGEGGLTGSSFSCYMIVEELS